MKQLLVHPEGRREGCMIGVSGVSVTVTVRSGALDVQIQKRCIYVYICSFFQELNQNSHSPVHPILRMNKSLLCFTDLSMWDSSSSRNVSLYKVTFDDQNNLLQGKNNCLF